MRFVRDNGSELFIEYIGGIRPRKRGDAWELQITPMPEWLLELTLRKADGTEELSSASMIELTVPAQDLARSVLVAPQLFETDSVDCIQSHLGSLLEQAFYSEYLKSKRNRS